MRLLTSGLLLVLTASGLYADVNPEVVISQLHGNFVELFNRSNQVVSLDGWSIQSFFAQYVLSDPPLLGVMPIQGKLSPGQHFLIQINGGTDLHPDVSGVLSRFTLYDGTVLLSRSSKPLSNAWPSVLDVADMLGYGPTATADGAPFLTNAADGLLVRQAVLRVGGGCVDTHNNATDFQLAAPAPRNSASPLTPCSTAPVLRANGILNSASYLFGAIAPGELLAVFGTKLGPEAGAAGQLTADKTRFTTELAGVRVLFDGVAAPVLYASAGQVNVIAPFEIAGKSQTLVRVEVNGVSTAAQTMAVASAAPGIFTALGTGCGPAAALNQDGTVNSVNEMSPLGGIVVLYATGAGQTQPAGEDGKLSIGDPATPLGSVSVTIGGKDAQILYAGNAPGLVQGVLQVNARIPAGLLGRQPVVLTVAGVKSQAEVNIAVDTAASAPADLLSVDISASDIAYDPGTHRLYASVGADAPANKNSIAVIDPSTGATLDWIPSAPNPKLLTISDDGHYLYTLLKPLSGVNHDSIQRIDLRTGKTDFILSLDDVYPGLIPDLSSASVTDLQSLPGQPRSVAIAAKISGGILPVAILDDTVRRPGLGAPASTLSTVAPGVLWSDTRGLYITSNGVLAGGLYPRNVDTTAYCVQAAGGRLISATGLVMSGVGDDLLAELDLGFAISQRSFAYRADTGLAYYAGLAYGAASIVIAAFDLNTFAPQGMFLQFDDSVPRERRFFGIAQRLVPVGPAGLATISGQGPGVGRVFIFPLSLIQPLPASRVPAAQPSTGLRRFQIPTRSMAADSTGGRLYFSIPSAVPPIGNSVISFDVAAGSFGAPVFVGSEPSLLAVSTDDQYLHVALDGSRTVARLTLPGLTEDRVFLIRRSDGVLADVAGILSLPGEPRSVIIGRKMRYLQHTYGFAVYDDGIPRPEITTVYGDIRSVEIPLVNEAQVSADGTTLYGEQGEVLGAQLSRWRITPTGLEFDAKGTRFDWQIYLDLKCQRNRCLTGSGQLADTDSLQIVYRLATHANDGLAAMDLDNNRMFLLINGVTEITVESYDASTYSLTGTYTIPHAGSAHSFAKVSGDQLVIATRGEIILLPLSMLKPPV
ncbi:MAG: hypothetical protein JST11_29900 [Acidobacteria bacterium]|nr:hypothetical protein [Acidobacteriota bacterium]